MKRFSKDERGVAMITALLASMVVLAFALVAVSLASHTTSQSALDRKRLQGVNAGEAGVDASSRSSRAPATRTCRARRGRASRTSPPT